MGLLGSDIGLSPIIFTALTPNLYKVSVTSPLLIRKLLTKPVDGTNSTNVGVPVPLSHKILYVVIGDPPLSGVTQEILI